jgi:cell wall-associated NlpC family hydrolase
MDQTDEIRDRLETLGRQFAERYGDDLSDLTVRDGRVIRGHVLVTRQLRTVEDELIDLDVDLDVGVLEALDNDDPTLPLRAVHPGAGELVPLFGQQRDDKLTTEWREDDGLARVMFQGSDRTLIQLRDGSIGWSLNTQVVTNEVGQSSGPFVVCMAIGQTVAEARQGNTALAEAAIAAAHRASPYKLGGRSWTTGLDCSALTQLLVRDHLGSLLPRHSGDQMRVGVRVARPNARAGDLLFARARQKKILHVGLVVGSHGIVHACATRKQVTHEPIEAFFERYRFLKARRLYHGEPVG